MNDLALTIHDDAICFGDGLRVTFQRTLRIPDDGRRAGREVVIGILRGRARGPARRQVLERS